METKDAIILQAGKEFSVPVEKLYKAWVQPEALKKWWHPMGNQLQDVRNELQEGGEIRYVFQNESGHHAFTISGQYKEVQEAKRLVYSWNWEIPEQAIEDSQYILTIVFNSQGNGSRLEVTQENFKDEEALHPHREGWDKALNDLKQYVEGGAAG